jgi:hypothetical protein
MTTPMGRISMVVSPAGAAAVMPDGSARPLPSAQSDQMRQQVRQSPIVLLQRRTDAGLTALAAGETVAGGVTLQAVRVEAEETAVTLGIDTEGHIRQVSYRGPGPTGAPADIVTDFDDFRPAGGLTLPHARTTTVNGEVMQRTTVTQLEVNPTLADEVFAVPSGQP